MIDGMKFRQNLLRQFPELKEEIEENEGLVHMEMGALESLANEHIKNGNFEGLQKAYNFIATLFEEFRGTDPSVINAISVSFLEGLNFEDKKYGKRAKSLLPPELLKLWNEQMEHNQKIGWVK
ncbi:MAG: hypothetical protein C0620_11830 [Desulfuromonas sp.]|nr:MAG: hypothetical protein C0620_11830 [Desulfuromonas sp.]